MAVYEDCWQYSVDGIVGSYSLHLKLLNAKLEGHRYFFNI